MHRPPHQYEEEEGYRRAGYGREELQPPLLVDGGRCVERGLITLQLLKTCACRRAGGGGGMRENTNENEEICKCKKIGRNYPSSLHVRPRRRDGGGKTWEGRIVLPAAVSARRLCDPPPSPCIRCGSEERHWQSLPRHRPRRCRPRRSIALRNRHRHDHPSPSSSSSLALRRGRIRRTIPSSRPRRRPPRRRRRREGRYWSNDAMISLLSYSSTSYHNSRRGGDDDVAMRMAIRSSSSP